MISLTTIISLTPKLSKARDEKQDIKVLLECVNPTTNTNKFYEITLRFSDWQKTHNTRIRYGRIGKKGVYYEEKLLSVSEALKLVQAKLNKNYTLTGVYYPNPTLDQIFTTNKTSQPADTNLQEKLKKIDNTPMTRLANRFKSILEP